MFLTFLTFLPLLGAVLLTLIPRDEEGAIKQTALAFAVADFVLSIFLWTNFDSTTHEMQFEYSVPWISSWGVSYHTPIYNDNISNDDIYHRLLGSYKKHT
jgi:NADH-quinone oxidoreductase subunit M